MPDFCETDFVGRLDTPLNLKARADVFNSGEA
jgi:hypothetical protein